MNRRLTILIGVVGLLIIGFLIFLGYRSGQPQQLPPQQKEGDIIANQPVTLNHPDDLASSLLAQQFLDLKSQLQGYIKKKYPNATEADINNTVTNQDGSISFDLAINSYGTTLKVTVKRLVHGAIEIDIPQTGFTTTIDVYGSNNTPTD